LRAHAEQLAHAAADQALASATAYDGSAADGKAVGSAYLADSSGGTLLHPSVSVTRNANVATATVTGDVIPFLPFVSVAVAVHVEGPVEKFVPAP
jgi:hypothetical protein